MRPGLADIRERVELLHNRLTPAQATLDASIEGLKTLYQQAQGTQNAVAVVHASLPTLADRIARIERRLVSSAVWSGGLSGKAVDYAGNAVPELTAKYHAELAFWEAMVRRESIPTWGKPFEEVFGIWQRIRMTELAEFLGLGEGDSAFEALPAWTAQRTAIEIGSGPFPSISLTPWRQAIAVDPLADGYVTENLVPKIAHAAEVTFLAAVGESVPLPANCADLAVLENCLDHVDDPALVLRECRRLLRPDGLAWLLVDLMDYKDHMHPHPFCEKSIKGIVATEGFEVVRERISDHKSHPEAYGEYRALLRIHPPYPGTV
ncbi:MAG: class I SAM-dependent methyltransferase [Phycisphaerales bacterium]|nr:class I SAM-dependent methyltransferase [Phycisphaerales bacterium]